ncbi:MAG: glycosyltransferase family 2 protein [Faecalibacterium prausnitzii]
MKTLLPRCVASLQAQTWQDFEVWLVTTAAPTVGDCSATIAVKDARIHVLHKENGGQGLARDLGLDHAQGEYICYVDSDDEVLPNLLEDALRAAREADADIVCYGYYKQPLDGEGMPLQRSGPRLPALSGVYT